MAMKSIIHCLTSSPSIYRRRAIQHLAVLQIRELLVVVDEKQKRKRGKAKKAETKIPVTDH